MKFIYLFFSKTPRMQMIYNRWPTKTI